MVNHLSFYYELNSISTISDELLNYCNSIATWNRPGWATFLQNPVPKFIYEKDPLICTLCEQGWKDPVLLKSEPESMYVFHRDRGNRPVSLNLLLGESNSDTLFMGNMIFRNQYELIKLNYKPGRYYLLNTARQHAVMNYGIDRYVMSLSPPERYLDPEYNHTAGNTPVGKNYIKAFFVIVDEFIKQNL